jgi:hypothetical protein
MSAIVVLLVIILALFAGAFLSRRRFGLLGLGLAAGAIISPIWTDNAGFVISATGVIPEGPLINALATTILILVPAVLFMFHGQTNHTLFGRIIGSLLFTLLATAFLTQPIGAALILSGPAQTVYQWFISYRDLIVSFGVAAAIADLLLTKASRKSEKKRH